MKILTTKDIAREFNVSERYIRMLAKARGIGQQTPGGVWIFSPKDVKGLKPGKQ